MTWWDAHNHPGGTPEKTAGYFRDYDRHGIEKGVFVGTSNGAGPFSNAGVLEVVREYGDRVLPFAWIDLDDGQPDEIDRRLGEGFVGLKVIRSRQRYDHDAYMPFYERAQSAGVPILFHTGYLGGGAAVRMDDYRPIYLLNIAKRFGDLRMICAHLGNPWWEEAYLAIVKMPNIYADLSGMTLRFRPLSLIGGLFSRAGQFDEKAFGKVVFGTDFEIPDQVEYHERLFEHFNIPAALREKVSRGNLQHLLKH